MAQLEPAGSLVSRNLDLNRIEWGAESFRSIIDNFEDMLGPDEMPAYFVGGGVTTTPGPRSRLHMLLVMTLRGQGGPEEVRADPGEPESYASLHEHLSGLRRFCPALHDGDYRSVETWDPDVYGFVRETPVQRMLVILNFASRPLRLRLSGPVGKWVAGTHSVLGDGMEPAGDVGLLGHEGRMYEFRRAAE